MKSETADVGVRRVDEKALMILSSSEAKHHMNKGSRIVLQEVLMMPEFE